MWVYTPCTRCTVQYISVSLHTLYSLYCSIYLWELTHFAHPVFYNVSLWVYILCTLCIVQYISVSLHTLYTLYCTLYLCEFTHFVHPVLYNNCESYGRDTWVKGDSLGLTCVWDKQWKSQRGCLEKFALRRSQLKSDFPEGRSPEGKSD